MRLIDRVVQHVAPMVVEFPDDNSFTLPGVAETAAIARQSPLKFVLGEDVSAACKRIMEQWPDLLDPADRLLRLPAQTLWIEWSEVDATRAGGKRQVAMLVQADEGGRSGTLRSFWECAIYGCDVSQACLQFDLDGTPAQPADGSTYIAPAPLPAPYSPLMQHAVVAIGPEWCEYFRHSDDADNLAQVHALCALQVGLELPFLLSFVRLLQRPSNLSTHDVSRARLNRSRTRRRQPELMDHVELTLSLGHESILQGPANGARQACRQHMVRGHLVRRGSGVHWRSPHLRGDPSVTLILSRTCRVALAPQHRLDRESFHVSLS